MSLAGNRLDILGETVNVRPKNYRQDRTSMRSPRQSRSIENSDSMVDKRSSFLETAIADAARIACFQDSQTFLVQRRVSI